MLVHGFNTIIVQLMPNYFWNQLVVLHSGRKAISLDGMTTLHRTIWHDKQKNCKGEERKWQEVPKWLTEVGRSRNRKRIWTKTWGKTKMHLWKKGRVSERKLMRLIKDQSGKKVKAFCRSQIVSSKTGTMRK